MRTATLIARKQGFEENPFEARNFQPGSSPTDWRKSADFPAFSRQRFQSGPFGFDPFSITHVQQSIPDQTSFSPVLGFAEALRSMSISRSFPFSRKLAERFTEISSLQAGWDDEKATAPQPEVIAHAVGLVLFLQGALPKFEDPFVVPTISGFLQLEWHGEHRALEFEATAYGWSIVGSETQSRGERTYHEADTAGLDVEKLLAAYRWFTGLELLWPII